MQTVKVNKRELLNKIRENRQKHHAVVEEAWENYRKKVVEELDRMKEDALAGKRISQYIKLSQPQDHSRDFDQVIAMLEMEVSEFVELDFHQFATYVQNRWPWAEQFASSNKAYVVSSSAAEYIDNLEHGA